MGPQKPKKTASPAPRVAALRLADLSPEWLRHEGRDRVGVSFDCPCGAALVASLPACSRITVAFANPPDGGRPAGQPAWRLAGETFGDLSLSPSIKRTGGCGWHGHVVGGTIADAGDWTRKRGQT